LELPVSLSLSAPKGLRKRSQVAKHHIMLMKKHLPFGVACSPVFDKVKGLAKEKSSGKTLDQPVATAGCLFACL